MSEAASARSPTAVATVFFTVFGNVVLVIATLVFGGLSTIVGWIPPRGRWMYLCAWVWSFLLLPASGIRTKARFAVPLDPKQGYVFMANHESMMDIPALLRTLPGETRMLAKRSLFKIPIFGWGLYAGGFIPVDRGNRAGAKVTFDAAIRCLKSGRSILVFPEEQRHVGGDLLPFAPGGFLMALKTGYPIVPVGLHGTGAIRPPHSYVNRPGPVVVSYGEPIEVAGLGVRDRAKLTEAVRERIEKLRSPAP